MLNHASLTCVLSLTALSLSAQTAPAPGSVATTPIVGMASAQTARLNLLNPGVLPPAVGATCTVSVAFVDGGGTVLKSASLTIAPGKTVGFNLRSDVDLQLVAVGDRREIRAMISTPSASNAAAANAASICNLIPTLEIFDTITGQSQVTLTRLVTIPSAPTTTPPATNQ